MKNTLVFFYNIYVDDLKKISDNYYFIYQNNNYAVFLFDRNIEEAKEIYSLNLEMLNNGVPVYKIILTKDNNILFLFEEKYYILMQIPYIHNRIITFDDLVNFNFVPQQKYKSIDKSAWNMSWPKKVDYIEYQFSQVHHKYPIIEESINYYIGIWENAISYYNNNSDENNIKFVSHKRITVNSDLLSFYNPLNIIIDYKERDIVDYLKSYVYTNNWTKDNLYKFLNKFTNVNIIRFISRSLFPSNYFDLYEDIVLGNSEELEINQIIKKNNIYERYLNYVFLFYKRYNIPLIEWIIKKD